MLFRSGEICFFQAEDGIRDHCVTGVQTCALPILSSCIWNLGVFPDDARASHCPFVLTSFTGWSSERCPGIGFLPRGDREIGVLRNVEAPTRPRLECRREPGLILRCDRKVGNPFQTKQGSRPSCRDQEGSRGSEEVVPENLGVPLQGDRDAGELCGGA